MRRALVRAMLLLMMTAAVTSARPPAAGFAPGARVLVDAHNAYPSDGKFTDRIDRALEQRPAAGDRAGSRLVHRSGARGVGRIASSRTAATRCGDRADLRGVLLREGRADHEEGARRRIAAPTGRSSRSTWTSRPTSRSITPRSGRCSASTSAWLTTAERTATAGTAAPLRLGPMLVLTGSNDVQQVSFHDASPSASGCGCSVRSHEPAVPGADRAEQAKNYAAMPPETLMPAPRHELSPLGELSVGRRRSRWTAPPRDWTPADSRSAACAGRARARDEPVDPLLHAERPRAGRGPGLGRELQLRIRRARAATRWKAAIAARRRTSSRPINTSRSPRSDESHRVPAEAGRHHVASMVGVRWGAAACARRR